MSKTREQFPLSTKKIWKKTLVGTLGWIILLFILGIIIAVIAIAGSANVGGVIALIVLGILILSLPVLLVMYLYQRWYFSFYFYDLTDDFIIIKKGPITPKEITIPYERIQDVYVDQDIFDRLFGLYDVHLSSATISSGMQAHIDGVERPAADGLREMLLKTVQQRISKNRTKV